MSIPSPLTRTSQKAYRSSFRELGNAKHEKRTKLKEEGTFSEARRVPLLSSPEKQREKKSTLTMRRRLGWSRSGPCADEHDGPQHRKPATERVSSIRGFFTKCTGVECQGQGQNFWGMPLRCTGPSTSARWGNAFWSLGLAGKLRETSLSTAGHHEGQKTAVEGWDWGRKLLRHTCPRYRAISQKARGRSSGKRKISWNAKVGSRTRQLNEWTRSSKPTSLVIKQKGVSRAALGVRSQNLLKENSWFTLTTEANGELFLTKPSTKL